MSTHETEREQTAQAPARPVGAPAAAPASELEQLASLVGNRAFAQVISRRALGTQAALPSDNQASWTREAALARSLRRLNSGAPVTVSRQGDEEEQPTPLDDGQKQRMRAMCIAPIRSAAGRLGAGEKADVRSVIRHLRPVQSALRGFAAKGQARQKIMSSAEELGVDITVLDSLSLSDRQAIYLARTAWQTARRQVAATRAQLKAPKDAPPNDVRAIEEGRAHLDALSQQIAATIQDLVEAPRTQEGFKQVMDTAGQLIEQFDSFKSPDGEVPPSFVQARATMFEGIARIAPLALGKEAALNEVKASLGRVANELAGLADDEVQGEPEPEQHDPVKGPDPGEPGKAPDDQIVPPPNKPEYAPPPAPSPNPLPPPPPPPPQ